MTKWYDRNDDPDESVYDADFTFPRELADAERAAAEKSRVQQEADAEYRRGVANSLARLEATVESLRAAGVQTSVTSTTHGQTAQLEHPRFQNVPTLTAAEYEDMQEDPNKFLEYMAKRDAAIIHNTATSVEKILQEKFDRQNTDFEAMLKNTMDRRTSEDVFYAENPDLAAYKDLLPVLSQNFQHDPGLATSKDAQFVAYCRNRLNIPKQPDSANIRKRVPNFASGTTVNAPRPESYTNTQPKGDTYADQMDAFEAYVKGGK